MHRFTKNDLTQATNLARLMKKSKMELEGLEILAAGDVIRWVGKLIKDIEVDLASQEALSSVKTLEDPIDQPSEASPEPAANAKKQKVKR